MKDKNNKKIDVSVENIGLLQSTLRSIESSISDFELMGETRCLILKARSIVERIKEDGGINE